jgi:hypothetical protein
MVDGVGVADEAGDLTAAGVTGRELEHAATSSDATTTAAEPFLAIAIHCG